MAFEYCRPRVVGLEWCPIEERILRWMERPFEELEVTSAIFECSRDKAPGQMTLLW